MKRYVLLIGAMLLCFMLHAQSVSYNCRYWFDQNHAQVATAAFSDSSWQAELDVGSLSEGLHTLFLQICDTSLVWNMPKSYIFYKAGNQQGISSIVYHCWFDQDIEHQRTDSLGDGHFLLDVDTLVDGLHTVNVMLEDNAPKSYMFMKVAVQDPSAAMQYRCWFDNDCSTEQTGLVGTGFFELEVGDLSNGLHTVSVQLDKGTPSIPKCYMFYKRPVGGNITKWEYWLNGDLANRHTTDLSPFVDTLDIIALLPLESWPIRSTCFHFHPNGDEPYINAKNEISFYFWDAESHIIDKSAFYIDENVSEPIVADSLERNTTVSFDAPRDNQIHWFKLAVNRGDYLSFQADKACTMQLFASSGEEVYAVLGPESVIKGGLNVGEDGVYYLAVHDVTGSGDFVSITYNWIYRYSILSYNVHQVGNGGCSTITFKGNGYNSLLDVYLVNSQNDTIRRLDIGHESNSTTTVTFDFYQKNLGAYDAVFEFYGETIHINGALEVQEPVDIVLTSFVSYPSQFLRNTACTYTYLITNNGNMSAYAVPIYLYISTPTENGISKLEFDGLNLPSLLDYFDSDSLSQDEIEDLRILSDEIKEDHYFFMYPSVDEDTGDSIVIRSNYFFLNLAPFETKTLSLSITSDEALEVWMTVPNDTVWPIITNNRYSVTQYCCSKEIYACRIGVACTVIDYVDLVAGAFPGVVANIASLSSCICDAVSLAHSILSFILCEGNPDDSFFKKVHSVNTNSIVGFATSCLRRFIPGAKYKDIAKFIGQLKTAIGAGTISAALDCNFSHEANQKNPSCPGGNRRGGKSNPVNSNEPNEIRGYLSESGSHYMMQEIQNITYEIESENDTTATAAAHTIIVRDTLDINKFDVASLAAYRVTIGDKVMELNGEHEFIYTLDLRPELYVIAQIQQECDPETGIVVWTINSLDPMTMEPTEDPNQGALPINYNGEGIATFTFNINLKEHFPDGTEISNRVGIIFDLEDPVITDTWTNIVDAVKPTSHIEEVTVVADSLNFSFVSEDSRSGIWYHTLYYRNDSTDMQWQVKKPQITENSLLLRFDEYQTTEYLVMATDSAGNVEEKEMVAEYIYYYEGPGPANQTDDLSAGWNWWSTYIEMNGTNGLELLESGLGTNGLNIKSGNGNSVEYIPDWEMWWGDEIEVRNESMYEINVAQAGTVTVAGTQAIPGAHPITLAPGWNWIGYPVNASLPTETALASLSPTEEDVIQSRNGYSMYWPDFGFWGDVEYMTPGSGYKYMSNKAQPQTLTYPSSRGKALAYRPKTVETRPEAMQHQYLMDIVAVAELEGEELRTGHYELIALSDGQPRGRASLRYCEPNGRHVAMLVVYGDASETLEFRLLDTESGRVYEGLERMDFKADKVVGGLRKPFTMHFGKEQEDAFALEGMFPNPAKAGETVYVNMVDTSVEEGTSGIELYNALGEHIPVSCTMGSPLSFKAPQAAGVYMVRLTSRGEVYHGTLIVTQ